MQVSDEVNKAYEMAKEVRNKAYAKYSNFRVGSSLKVKGHDEIFIGCNVENISYGGTICAERNAITSAVARLGEIEIEYILVVCDTNPVTVPCGFCLQFLSEFSKGDMKVYLGDLEGVKKVLRFDELLPNPFNTLT